LATAWICDQTQLVSDPSSLSMSIRNGAESHDHHDLCSGH
jgi:hypothetical protein